MPYRSAPKSGADCPGIEPLPATWHKVVPFLQIAERAPGRVLLILCGVRIFLTFEPEGEPIHSYLLRHQTVPRPLQNVDTLGDVDHINRPLEARQSSKPFPLLKQRTRSDCLYE